ncbi:hypothetical protein PENTCL1PPCAC_30541, partial [Pristionchus entomophagus]
SKCVKCPGNFTTMYDGAQSKNDCYVSCLPGYYTSYNTDPTQCIPCGIGYYETKRGALEHCKNCDHNSTLHEASTSSSDCVNTCDEPGKEIDENGSCRACVQGTFKDDPSDLRCGGNCPYGLTTAGTGSTSLSQCTVINCPKDRRVTTDTTLTPPNPSSFNIDSYCPLCSRGFAQTGTNQTECRPCNKFKDAANLPGCKSECEGREDDKS